MLQRPNLSKPLLMAAALLSCRGFHTSFNVLERPPMTAFRLASWNIMNARQGSWDQRRGALLQRLQKLDADVLALQEASPRHPFPSLDNDLRALGYSAHRREAADGIEPPALYVRESSFQVVWAGCHKRTVEAVLRPRTFSGADLGIINVHLMGALGKFKERAFQVRKALRRLRAQLDLDDKDNPSNLVVCGDFNEGPDEGPLHRLLTSGAPLQGMSASEIPGGLGFLDQLQLIDAYAEAGADGVLSWPAQAPKRRIDYILLSANLECIGLPTCSDLDRVDYPSDHVLLAVDVGLRPSKQE